LEEGIELFIEEENEAVNDIIDDDNSVEV